MQRLWVRLPNADAAHVQMMPAFHVQVAAGLGHCLALARDGRVFSWGWNSAGQLGLGHTAANNDVVSMPSFTGLVSPNPSVSLLAAGRVHSVATHCKLESSDSEQPMFVWGNGKNGRLGLGDQESLDSPEYIDWEGQELSQHGQVLGLACGCDHTLASAR